MPKFKFNKLVRDKIVDQQIVAGSKPVYRVLDQHGHVEALVDKIMEEAKEIINASKEEAAEEIGDVQQAIDDLVVKLGLNPEDVAQAQQRKIEKAGGFKKGIFVEYVEVDEKDKWTEYYRKNADRYPEIN